ncbi:MAG: acyl-CoA dehydrogenase family protein [Burkholderiales bacterium]|nr:acyl-CoA dehydrogenase family protein [Burkholderiales bacterium]
MQPQERAWPYFGEEHAAFRESVRRFVREEISPNAHTWDEAGTFPRELYGKAARAGILGLGFPEEYGGFAADVFHKVIQSEELAASGCGGVCASLMSHTIGSPPIAKFGSAAMKTRVLPAVLAGEKISALAITEPSGGSDVASLKTTARRDGDEYVVNGAKMFITSGMRADYYSVAVRTGGPGAAGVSLLLIERDRPGFTRNELKKTGWWSSDTAALFFDEVRVPVTNLIGEEGRGFKVIMANFNMERLGMAAQAVGYAQAAFDDALAWARERSTFGQRLIEHQVIRHKLVDMQMRIQSARAYLYDCAYRVGQGESVAAELAMLKNCTTQAMQFCADQAVQILGGAGFMRGSRAERIYREVKVMMIGGGAEEIMKDLAARQMGW